MSRLSLVLFPVLMFAALPPAADGAAIDKASCAALSEPGMTSLVAFLSTLAKN